MSTKRAAGTQFTQKGVVQGNSLVDPKTGQPVDVIIDDQGAHRLAVDANISATIGDISVELDADNDSVRVEDPNTGSHIRVETDGSINVNTQIDASTGDNIAIQDSQGHELNINPDGSINVQVGAGSVSTPTIANLNVATKNTEVSYVLPINTQKFKVRARGLSKVQLSYNAGTTNSNYYTIDPGNTYEEQDLNAPVTIYLQTSKDNEVIEILSWS